MTDDNHTYISLAQARALYKPKRVYPKEVNGFCAALIFGLVLFWGGWV